MAEVVAHQPFDALPRLGARIPEQVRRPLLQLVAEHVLVAAGLEVQRRSHAQQKILGVVEPRRVGRAAPQQQRIGQQRDGARRRQVAQRPRRFLHVRLELIQRRVERGVPLLDQLQQRRQDVARASPACETATLNRSNSEPGAGDRTRIEQRQQELRVVGLEPGKSSSSRTWWPTTTPRSQSGWRNPRRNRSSAGADAAAEQHEQIDVGMQAEVPPAVPAEGEDRDRALGRAGVGEQLPQHRVDAIGIALERAAAAGASPHVRRQLGARRVERASRAGTGRPGWSPT